MEGETPACDVDRSWPYFRSSVVSHVRTGDDALNRYGGSNVRRVRQEVHSLRYSCASRPATTPDLATIPETSGSSMEDRIRRRPRRFDPSTRAESPESAEEFFPHSWSAHHYYSGNIFTSTPHCAASNYSQGNVVTESNFSYFDGDCCNEDYLKWEHMVDTFFNYTNISQERQVRYVVRKLTGRAKTWWALMLQARHLEGRSEVKSWRKMKSMLRSQFLTTDYELLLNEAMLSGVSEEIEKKDNDVEAETIQTSVEAYESREIKLDLSPISLVEDASKGIEIKSDDFAKPRVEIPCSTNIIPPLVKVSLDMEKAPESSTVVKEDTCLEGSHNFVVSMVAEVSFEGENIMERVVDEDGEDDMMCVLNTTAGILKKFSGDVTIEPNASCLVMTTEIWRSMQYKGSEVMREVAWIILDEVHYMRDRERGVVWEESIVMAPKNSRFVFLSATVPNAKEFADWVAKIHHQPCHIVYTDYRPTPLQHYIFPSSGDDLYLVVDEKGKFHEDSFQKALNALVPAKEGSRKRDFGKLQKALLEGKTSEESDIFKLVKMLIQRQYDPVILFSFSKRECEFLAMQMAKMDLNDDQEKINIETIFWSAMDLLSDDERKLPQVSNILPLLKRGIGVHHSGLLPILKEVIEILFQEGLIKCLFATETFSIGLNMPAKTVVFTNVRKFDGDKFRWLSSGEYIQMSGRAGRRGIDQRGICILMVDEKMEPSTAKMMVKGSADFLNSAFHLSYNMLLNQLRCEDGDPEKLLRHSFYQFQSDRALPDLEKQAKELIRERDSIVIEEEDSLKDYYNLLQQYNGLKKDVHDIVLSPKHCLPYLQPGRLVSLFCDSNSKRPSFFTQEQVTWGIIINFQKLNSLDEAADKRPEDSQYTVDVLTRCVFVKEAGTKKSVKIVHLKEQGEPAVVSVPLSQIDSLSIVRVYIPKDLVPLEARENMLKVLSEVYSRFLKDGIPLLDPEEDMKVQSNSFRKAARRIEALDRLFEKHEIRNSPLIQQNLRVLHDKLELSAKIKSVKKSMRTSTALAFKDELKARKRVLRRLGYITSEDVVEVKGQVACEISSADELTLTELMLSGSFKDISIEEMVALLSCFVWQEKLQDAPKPREELDSLFAQLHETARRVANLQLDCKVQMDVDSFVNSFRPDIMEAVYAWAKGSKFFEIMELSSVFEGSLIRAIRRLEEILQQLSCAAKSIGETELEAKFQDAVTKIKRDIVFAASLYL